MTLAALTATLGLILLVLLVQRLFLSFAAQTPKAYAASEPAMDIRKVLSGPIASEGVIFGPTGQMTSRFVARMEGTWAGNHGTLAEDFHYANGTTQQRLWTLGVAADGTITGTAPDIIGTARGRQSGATVQMTYRIQLPDDAGGHVLDVVDWMYLMPNGTILNKSEMRKFGIKVAELVASIRPMGA
ncbi:Protein of unknown function DUF3833 [Paracoccaceae bacterium]|jgi:hypothetical protein